MTADAARAPTAHTPSPWLIERGPASGAFYVGPAIVDSAADARLIAAAPMLLATLHSVAREIEQTLGDVPLLATVRSAIKQAEGAP